MLFGTESASLLHRMYLLGRPQVLYSGPVTVDGHPKNGWVFYSPVSHRWSALTRMTLYKAGWRGLADAPAGTAETAPPADVSRHSPQAGTGRAVVLRGIGAVVHVASVNALSPMPCSAVYSAAKTFLYTYALAIWHENRDRGVVFQTLLPGTTATSFHDRQHTELPAWAAAPDKVADASLSTLGRHPVCVPGVFNCAFRLLGAGMPVTARTAAAAEALRASLGVGGK